MCVSDRDFKAEISAYRFVDHKLVEITSEKKIVSIEEAITRCDRRRDPAAPGVRSTVVPGSNEVEAA